MGRAIRALTVIDAFARIVTEVLPAAARDTVDVEPADTAQIGEALTKGPWKTPNLERLLGSWCESAVAPDSSVCCSEA